MNTREEFGKYTLLRKLTEDSLGETFRAGRSDGTGSIEQVVLLRVFNGQGLDGNALWQHTAQRAEIHKQLSSPNLAHGLDYGEEQNVPYAAYDYISGKDLGSLWEEARKQHNPIPTDQALLITERIALGLTSAYETRLRDQRILHGFVNPNMVMVSNEGEIRLLGFESAPGLRMLALTNAAPRSYTRYLSPEALAGEDPHKSDDVYSLGVILYELLTGKALPAATTEGYAGVIDQARLAADEIPMPDELAGLLKKSLVPRGERIGDAVSWHKELNRLMIEGQYNPTTFNLAFFMHSLFRDDIERENREIQAEKSGEKQQMMVPDPGTAADTVMLTTADLPVPQPVPEPAAAKRSMLPMVAVFLILLIGGAAAAYYFLVLNKPPAQVETSAPPPPPAPVEPEGPSEEEQRLAAELEELRAQMAEQMAQVAEMVDSQSSQTRERQRQMQEEAAALQQQLDDAKAAREREAQQRLEAEAAAQEAAERLAQQQEAEAAETAAAEQQAAQQEGTGTPKPATTQLTQVTPPPTPPATTTPPPTTTTTTPPPTTTTTTTTARPRTPPPPPEPSTVRRGQLVTPGAGVVQPDIIEKPDPRIPPMARRARRGGVVHLQILVDENGKVVDVKQEGEKLGLGLDEEAIRAARRIRARPATKDGVPVKMWIGVNYQFAL